MHRHIGMNLGLYHAPLVIDLLEGDIHKHHMIVACQFIDGYYGGPHFRAQHLLNAEIELATLRLAERQPLL